MANSFGKERGEGRTPEGVVKEFEFEEYQAACGGMAQVLFQELGRPGLSRSSVNFRGDQQGT